MDAPFDHLVLTRFSAVPAEGAPPAHPDWLRYRLAFFYDTAYPSMRSQRAPTPFRWLVLFDDRCPQDFRAEVEDLAAGVFTPIWTRQTFHRRVFAPYVRRIAERPYLITTRLDSDDAVARDFIAAVQRRFAPRDLLFVSFTRGLQIDRSGAVYRRDQLSGSFLSLVERRVGGRDPMTVYASRHERAASLGPVLEVQADPMWIQVLHGANLANVVAGPRVRPGVVAERFDISLGYRAEVPRLALATEKIVHRARLIRRWLHHPGEAVWAMEARWWRVTGTRERPLGRTRRWSDVLRAVLPFRS